MKLVNRVGRWHRRWYTQPVARWEMAVTSTLMLGLGFLAGHAS